MANEAVQYPTFQPAMRVITAITNDVNALVTTSFAHQYQTGLIIRFLIPPNFGMEGLNQLKGIVTVVNDTQFTVDIDTNNFDPFVIPAVFPGRNATSAQSIPVGEVNELLTESTQNVLPYPLHMIE